MLEESVVGAEEGGDLVQELLVVGMQRDPLVQHLPADTQLQIAALKKLKGDQGTSCMHCRRGSMPAMFHSPSHSQTPALLQCHPMFIPMFFLHCLQLEKPTPDESEIWVWRSGFIAPCPLRARSGRHGRERSIPNSAASSPHHSGCQSAR